MLDVYREGRDAYKEFASIITGKPYNEITKAERTQAKPAVLGCGYGMSGRRLAEYAADMGIGMTEIEAASHVEAFRSAYPEVRELWTETENLAYMAVDGRTRLESRAGLVFDASNRRYLAITLPSGRKLFYLDPAIEYVDRGYGPRASLTFSAANKGGFGRQSTYGSKLVENIVQAIARDVLTDGLLAATREGYNIIGHVHDEIVCEEEIGSKYTAERLEQVMSVPPAWGPDLVLAAEGQVSAFYSK
jgi:DNA polymerase